MTVNMFGETQQWRACAADQGSVPDGGPWHLSLDDAARDAGRLGAQDAYDDVWVETRTVSQPARVPREAWT